MPDAIHLYRRFLAGQSGICIFTGRDDCHAFVTEDEIEATAGSRHDLHHFVWLDRKPGGTDPHGVGLVSDDHIDVLLAKRRIALTYSERDGPVGESREGLKAAFLLGATRMSRVLGLPVDAQKRVLSETIDTLPLVLRIRIERLALPNPIPLARLVEKIIPLGATAEDAEARGRLVVLSKVAVGTGLADIEDEAERCAAWIADRAGREAHAGDIVGQMIEQLAKDKGKLQ
jgi:hypothetical protein